MTRCTAEENGGSGVTVQWGSERVAATTELVDCVIHKNGDDGLIAGGGSKVTLRGGAISGNKRDGVVACIGGKITVSKELPTDRQLGARLGHGGQRQAEGRR